VRFQSSKRIFIGNLKGRNLKETYWDMARTTSRIATLAGAENRAFAGVVIRDMSRFLSSQVQPIGGESGHRAHAAVAWLKRAQDATGNGGVSLGFFPCEGGQPWHSAYPETTGYIITSLLKFAALTGDDDLRRRALDMTEWEMSIQMPSGAVQGGPYAPPAPQTPCAFNTGMVLDGLCSAYEATKDSRILNAARRAARYLAADMTDQGYFQTNGQFVKPGKIKTYNVLCAWAMYRHSLHGEDRFVQRQAVRAVEAALRQQQPNGWFDNNCLTRPSAPLVHTIGYTLQGILEVGIISEREDFIEAVRRGVDPLLMNIKSNGFLPGRFYSDWQPASFSSCLTGSAQIAVVCYRLFEITGEQRYCDLAHRLLNFLKPLQQLDSNCAPVNGALAGSFPIFGEYMTASYPNWATKYFLDALMFQESLTQPGTGRTLPKAEVADSLRILS
jgi:uncharacterized protein YyaL (SSP411 family)